MEEKLEKRTTKGKSKLYESVTETIGDTPCIRINTLAPKHVNMYVKAEFFNPASSVKDRLAISIIEKLIFEIKNGMIEYKLSLS